MLITELGADFEIFCMLSPKIKEDVPIKNETTVRRFCVTEVIIVESVLVFFSSSANTSEISPQLTAIMNKNMIYRQI